MSNPDCSDVCEIIHDMLNGMGFKIDPSEADHTDMIEALNQTSLIHDRDLNKTKAIEEAYRELWAAVENGDVDDDFFDLRSKYRKLIQVPCSPAQEKVVTE